MVVAIFLTPQLLSFHISFTHPDGLIGTVLCKLLTTANFTYVGAGASVFTLICISVERYFNVLYPHGAKRKLTKRKLKVLVPCSWIFGVSLKVPAFLSYVYVKEVGGCVYLLTEEWMGKLLSMSWFIFLGFLPVVVMTALYSRVVYALWFKGSDNAGNNSQQGVMRVRKRVTLMVFIVSIIFGVCWGTNTVGYLMVDFFPSHKFHTIEASNTIVLLNSAINPIIYALVNERFKEKFKAMLCCRRQRVRVHPGGESHGIENNTNPTDAKIETGRN
ncbi:QRFP-like peptide receptor [Porites lutea]